MKIKQVLFSITIMVAFFFPLLQTQAQNTFPSSGNAGIGTTSPASAMEIKRASFARLRLTGTDPGGDRTAIVDINGAGGNRMALGTLTNNGMIFLTNNFVRMTLNSDGNFGVGVASPETRLHVNGADNNGTTATLKITSGTQNMLLDGNEIDVLSSDSALFLNNNVTGDVNIANGGGNVGIGTATPDKRFVVNGTASTFKASPNQNIFRNTSIGAWLDGKAGIGPQMRFQGSGGPSGFIDVGKDGDGDFVVERFDEIQFSIEADGNIGIGTSTPQNKLDVCGTVRAEEVKVETGWCDYVFEKDYKLTSLEEVKAHIAEKGHLHKTPSAAQVEAEGVKLAAATVQQQEKIEEIFLHMIEMNERLKTLEQENATLKARLAGQK